tara:strand:- start:9481 stop:9615 length:135 start_codon:yes stop_codon:yes gene_type:complete
MKKITSSISIGAGLGMIFGAALGNIGVGLVLGAMVGLVTSKARI